MPSMLILHGNKYKKEYILNTTETASVSSLTVNAQIFNRMYFAVFRHIVRHQCFFKNSATYAVLVQHVSC